MSKLRSVSTAFWSDPFIEDLTPNQKLLFLYLITNEKTNMLGIYEASVKKISFETGIKKEDVSNGLKAFERLNKVKYRNNYVILVNYMKHQNFNTNMKKSAIDIYNNLPNALKDNDLNVSKDSPTKGFETLLNHFGMVRKVEVEYEAESEEESKLEIEVKKEVEQKVYSKEVHTCYENCLNSFDLHLHPKNKNTWLSTIEKLERIDKIPFNHIERIVELIRKDDFWSKNFLSLPKLRKKNKDGLMYVVVFNEYLKTKHNGNNIPTRREKFFGKVQR